MNEHPIIDENEWLIYKDLKSHLYKDDPKNEIKLGVVELKKFLESEGLELMYSSINPILLLENDDFSIKKMPPNYRVLKFEEITDFVAKSRIKLDEYILMKSVVLLEPHCNEILRT